LGWRPTAEECHTHPHPRSDAPAMFEEVYEIAPPQVGYTELEIVPGPRPASTLH